MLTNNYIRYHTRRQVLSPKNVRFYKLLCYNGLEVTYV